MKLPEWAERIRQVMLQLGVTQQAFARRLGVSPATLSRWVNAKNEPTPEMYVALGNLAGKPDGGYFWARAGIETFGALGETGRRDLQSLSLGEADLQLVTNNKISSRLPSHEKIVAIPLLTVRAYADEKAPAQVVSLAEAKVEDVLTAQLDWCPHPNGMVAMRVYGESMFPTIAPDAIVVIDTSSNDREELDRRIVIVSHKDMGFKIARLQKIANAFLLVSANHTCLPIDVTNAAKWKIFGEVLWWISRDSTLTK